MQKETRKYWKAVVNLVIALAALCVILFIVPRILVFFMPFVVGWIIAMIANPLVHFFEEKLKIRRKAGSAVVIIAVIAAIILLGYLAIAKIAEALSGFLATLPAMLVGLERDLTEIAQNGQNFFQRFSISEDISVHGIMETLDEYAGELVGKMGTPTVEAVGSIARNIPAIVIGVIMSLLSAYSFIAEKAVIYAFLKEHTPQGIQRGVSIMMHSIRYAVGGYIKAQLKIEIWIYLLMTAGLMLLHINYAPLIAFGIAVLDFFPFFGTGAVLVPWAAVKFLSTDYKMAAGLVVIWIVGQLVRQVIQPKYVGDSIGMPAVPTLFMLFIGYKTAGVLGMILAVPIAIALVDMYKAGVFDTTQNSIKVLIVGINKFRKLSAEELAEIKEKL